MSERLTLRIDGFAHGGRGVGRLDGKAVFVSGALPGELVEAEITLDRRRWAEAGVVAVLEPADGRVRPSCPFLPECGGCDLQHATPGLQLELKARVVREQLERLGRQDNPLVEPCRPVGPPTGYRNHVQLHADEAGRLGFHRQRSHDVVPIDACLVATEGVNHVLASLPGSGGAATVAVRVNGNQRAVVLTPGPGPLTLPEADTEVHLVQPDGSAMAMRGDGLLRETIAGIEFGFGPTDFFQVSSEAAAAIVEAVLDAAGAVAGQLVWDLYAGVGLLALPLARLGAAVVAVESSRSAARHAESNAAAAGLDLRVEQSAVRDFVALPDHAGDPPELVVLDPPRDGAGRQVCEALAALAPPSVIYVACDPASLARDVATLTSRSYRLVRAVPLDLFPMTHHVEVVATLAR